MPDRPPVEEPTGFRLPRVQGMVSAVAIIGAVLLLLASIGIGVVNERLYTGQKIRELDTQARILAAGVTAALAFDDEPAIREYLNALRANPEILAAGVYAAEGPLVASYALPEQVLPERAPPPGEAVREDDRLVLVVPVVEGRTPLGFVYVRTIMEPLGARLTRYGGTALLVMMAALLVAVLGAAQAALARANAQLAERADELAAANRHLQVEMAERARAEEALRQSQKMEAIGQLTGGVAHDFNNLLQALTSCLSMLRRRTGDPSLAPLFDAGQQAVDRGAKLTQQLLAFARRQALRPEAVDVRDRLLGMSELLARALRADIRLELDLEPGLWPVEVDPTQFELAILNLAVNARDAMPTGGLLRLEGRNFPADDGHAAGRVEITVRDTGTGMTKEVADRVFEPFFTTKGVGKGTGLGLSQVYGFANQSNGTVRLDTAPGKGTAVVLTLPRTTSIPGAVQAMAEVTQDLPGGRVLLVEDDPVVGAVLAATLEDLGYAVTWSKTADEAAALLARGGMADLLLTDMVMPGQMTGLDLAREARRLRPGMPVLMMTGYSEAAAAMGEFPVLTKPYQLDTLASALASVRTGGTKLRQEAVPLSPFNG
ncbi:MAG TPA: ATP-binding protein [Azospirillaceae bacterium]|nr:ATP-binding protein [Azospirillaceae bacterium]